MFLDVSAILQKTRSTQPSLTIDGTGLMPRVLSQQQQQQQLHHQQQQQQQLRRQQQQQQQLHHQQQQQQQLHCQQQQGRLQQQNFTGNDPTSTNPQPSTAFLQGAKKMKAHTQSYYERLIGKWIASNEADIPGPFAPLDLEPLLWFLQSKITATLSFPNNNNTSHSALCRFYDQLVAKECNWIERYPRPRELESSIKAMMTTTGGERDLFWTGLSLAYLRSEGGQLVQATVNGPYFVVGQRFWA